MKKFTLMLVGLSGLAIGCDDKCDDTGGEGCDTGIADDTATDPEPEPEPEPETTFSVTNSGTSIDLTVTNPHEGGYYFGMAETGAGELGWYGENAIDGDYKHEIEGETLSLGCVTTIEEIVESETTLHCSSDDVWNQTTWAFFGNENDDNYESVSFSGGDDPSYYE